MVHTFSNRGRKRQVRAPLELQKLEDRLAPAVANPGFENGLTNWQTLSGGDSSTRSSLAGSSPVAPQEGTQFALLTTNASTNTGSFSPFGTAGTEGTVLEATITANANQAFAFKWNFVTNEDVTTLVSNDDFALGQLLDASGSSVVQDLFSAHVQSGAGNYTQINLDPANFPMFVTGWQTVNFTITTAGTYKLRFVVSDVSDLVEDSGLALDMFSPGNSAPTTLTLNSGTINEGASFNLNGSFDDVDRGDTHQVTISWGDGSANTVLNPPAALTSDTTNFNASHTYTDNAARTVTVTVLDIFTFQVVNTTSVTVNNVNPTATLGNGGAVNEGSTGSVTFSSQFDPSTVDTTAGFRYSYDFDNDGTWDVGGSSYGTSVTAAAQTVPASYFADGAGTRTVKARIYDKDSGFTEYTTAITINNVNPTATFGNGGAVNEGSTGSVTFTSPYDPSPTDTSLGFRYSYDFDNNGTWEAGDGTYAGSVAASAQTIPANFFDDGPGTRTVRARIYDKDGGFTEYTTTLTINNVNPTASFGNGGAVNEGSTGTVSFSAQTDPSPTDTTAGLRYSYDFDNDGTWDAGDGSYSGSVTAASQTVPASYFADGPSTRTIRARIYDKDGGFTEYTTTITINNVNPTATFSNGGAVNEGSTGSVSFTSIVDPSPTDTTAGLRYSYDFDNDGTYEIGNGVYSGSVTATSQTIPASFFTDGAGTRTVRARIIDKDGGFTEYTTTITINNVNPTATLGNGGPVNEGSAGSVSFTSPFDPSSVDTAAGFRYSYDFNNDGTYEIGDGTYSGSVTATSQSVPTSYFDDGPATRTVRARIIDKDGGFTEYTTAITINNVNPTATFGNGGAVNEGATGSVSMVSPFDPSPTDTSTGFRYSYDFNNDGVYEVGDGATYGGSVTATTQTVPANYFADGPSTRTVRARIFDKDGGFTEYTTTITINNVAPTATFGNGGAVNEGSTGSVIFSGQTDPSPTDTTAGFRYSYDFNNDGVYEVGDGATYAGSAAAATQTISASFFADGAATRTIRARIFDKDGGFTEYTTTITINNVAPTATFGNGGAVNEGSTGGVSFANMSDPSPVDTAAGLRYSYDFDNNGTYEVGDGTYSGSANLSTQTIPASFFADGAGSRIVRARIIDKDNGFTEYTTTITINNVAPTATFSGPSSLNEAAAATVSFTGIFDPSPVDTTAGLRFAYDFNNDGTFDNGDGTYGGSTGATSAALPANLLDDGPVSRTVRARVIDKDGGSTDYTLTITISNLAPTATVSNSGPVNEGSTATVTLSGAVDPSVADTAAGFRYAYDFNNDGTYEIGDGSYSGSSTAATATVPAAFLADNPGRTVRVRILDKDGGSTDYTTTLLVNNVAPTVALNGAPASSPEGTTISLTSTATDPGPLDTLTYAWFVTKNGAAYGSGNASSFGFTPNDNGTYVVTLTVTDKDGAAVSQTRTIAVSNVAPIATLNGAPASIGEGVLVALTGSVTDPGSADTFTYAWRVTKNGVDFATGNAATFSFTPDDNATYGVTLTVTDDDGATGVTTATIIAVNVVPFGVLSGPSTVNEGDVVQVNFINLSDPAAADSAAGLRFAFDFDNNGVFDLGDGTYGGSVTVNAAALPANLSADGPITRVVRARVLDKDGGATDLTLAITVANVTPIVAAGADVTLEQCGCLSSTASFADPGAETWTATVDYGDGSGVQPLALNGKEYTLKHQYTRPGSYTLTVAIRDANGAVGTDTVAVTTNAVPGNVLYVRHLYLDLLNREAEGTGLNGWVNLINSGVSRAQVATGFQQTPEYLGKRVDYFFQTILNRTADPSGRETWMSFLRSGVSEADVMRAFFLSSEYQATHVSDESFIDGLYVNGLGRVADSVGRAIWLQALRDGNSRAAVAQTILTSAEGYKQIVDRYYRDFLDRGIDPNGAAGWVNLLQTQQLTLAQVAASLLASDEYFGMCP